MRPYYVVRLIVQHGMTKTATFEQWKKAKAYHERLRRIHGEEAVPEIERVPQVGRDARRPFGG